MRQTYGYLAGVFDLFHVGHVDVLERARGHCDRLVVGVLTDEWAVEFWGARPFVPLVERVQILEQLRCVDQAIVADSIDLAGLDVDVVFAVDGVDGVVGYEDLPASRLAAVHVPAIRLPASPVLRAALDRRQTRSSVA